ncbi:MAG TPA: sugar ABC transporter [Planctomycetaceae bacterium]|nr:sugar ABC transporter [Planctomycetaceae bacterium]HRF01322.1 sugar ABC transporter ATP-binding protein [Pirellulaceae bacterium]
MRTDPPSRSSADSSQPPAVRGDDPRGKPILAAQGLGKQFGGTWVLEEVGFDLHPGESLAIVGENGAGKSTLMKILSGAHRADAGRMTLDGRPFDPADPADALARGVAMIYQELSLAPDLSVEDNVMLGQERHRFGWLRRGEQRRKVREVLAVLGYGDLDPRRRVAELSVSVRQMIEIARALAAEARVVIFDEPTSSLTLPDVRRLFAVIDTLRARGVAILYISHFLEEVRRVCESYLVLRDGRQVDSGELSSTDDRRLVASMVGRDVDEFFPRIPHEVGEDRLTLRDLSSIDGPYDVNLTVRRGEILGIAGLVGAGRTELLRALMGLEPASSGSLLLDGKPLGASIAGRIARGLGMVSEDRKSEGLALGLPILENATLGRLRRFSRGGLLLGSERRRTTERLVESFRVRCRGIDQPVGELSGGNQQKVALARLAAQDAEILLLDEPTRGIDVGTKAEIYRRLGAWASEGRSIVMVSSYLPELLGTCDRIAVMSRGRIVAVRPVAEWTEHAILAAAIGGDGSSSDAASDMPPADPRPHSSDGPPR